MIVIIFIVIISLFILYMVFRKRKSGCYKSDTQLVVDINTSTDCSYGIWFKIDNWNESQKTIFRQTDGGTVDFEVFLGNLTNELFIYLPQNQTYVKYNNCEPGNYGNVSTDTCPPNYEIQDSVCVPKPLDLTEDGCRENCNKTPTCSGFSYNGTCLNYTFTDSLPTCTNNTEYNTELKAIKISSIPLNQWVKLVITFRGRSMDVFLNSQLIRTYLLTSAMTSHQKTVTVTPTGTGFKGYTCNFTYWNKSLSFKEIKVY